MQQHGCAGLGSDSEYDEDSDIMEVKHPRNSPEPGYVRGAGAQVKGDYRATVASNGHVVNGVHLGSSAPVLPHRSASYNDDPCSDRSERGGAPSEEAREGDQGGEAQQGDGSIRYPSYSWRETLAHIPGLLQRYPLAASHDGAAAVDEPKASDQEPGAASSAAAGYAQLEGNETTDYLNGQPAYSSSQPPPQPLELLQERQAPQQRTPSGQGLLPAGYQVPLSAGPSPGHAPAASEHRQDPLMPGAMPGDEAQEGEAFQHGHYDGGSSRHAGARTPLAYTPGAARGMWQQETPRSAYSQGQCSGARLPGSTRRACSGSALRDPWAGGNWRGGGRGASDLAAAWAEVELVKSRLAQRERELAEREAATARAEVRNRATARQLAELRRRLDDYGQELEEGVMALTGQQNALREERRQTAELQALCCTSTSSTSSKGDPGRPPRRERAATLGPRPLWAMGN